MFNRSYMIGMKGIGFVSGPLVQKYAGNVSHHLMHVSDWFPTLINLAGGSLNGTKPDGYDQWETMTSTAENPRKVTNYTI